MAPIKDTWLVDKPLAAVLWVSRLYGMAPLCFHCTRTAIIVYTSRTLYYLGVLVIVLAGLTLIADLMDVTEVDGGPTADPNMYSTVFNVYAFILLVGSVSGAFASGFAIKRYLQFTTEINKIKSSLNYSCNGQTNPQHAICLLFVCLFKIWIMPLTEICKSGVAFLFSKLFVTMVTMDSILNIKELLYVFVALHVNSSFEVLNTSLADVLSGMSEERANQYTRSYPKNVILVDCSTIPTGSINKAVDLLNNVRKDVKMTPRAKLAREIRALSRSFVQTCEVVQKLNDTENLVLLSNIIVITIATTNGINNIIQAVCCTDGKQRAVIIAIECGWFVCSILSIVLMVEPFHRFQKEFSQTKILVGHIMCHVVSVADPLYDATDNFLQVFHLNDVSIDVMGMFSLTRSTISTIIGVATTAYFVLMEI